MISIILISLAVLSGCRTIEPSNTPVIKAVFTSRPVIIDGKLDDEIWKHAYRYNMVALAPNEPSTMPFEKTIIYSAWDKNNFYVAVKCFDSDIAATGKKNEMHHYKYGDVIELFLKPDDQSWYWELYSTPAGKKTTFFFPGKGRLGMVNKVKKQ